MYRTATPVATDQIRPSRRTEFDRGSGPLEANSFVHADFSGVFIFYVIEDVTNSLCFYCTILLLLVFYNV